MAEKTIKVDIISKSTNPHEWIPIIYEHSPVTNVEISEKTALQLIQIPCLWITISGTTDVFNGNTITKYFPDAGGGGSGSHDNAPIELGQSLSLSEEPLLLYFKEV